jgi:hypothetical protein
LEYTGVWPDNCSSTFAARVNLSPDSPTEMLRTSFWILMSRMGLAAFLSVEGSVWDESEHFSGLGRGCTIVVRMDGWDDSLAEK